MQKDPNRRLTIKEAKCHAFFKGLDFTKLVDKKYRPPIYGQVRSIAGTDQITFAKSTDGYIRDEKESYKKQEMLNSRHNFFDY